MPRPASELLDPANYGFRHVVRARVSDMDLQRHINNVAMMAIIEDARASFNIEALKLETQLAGRRIFAARNEVDYLAEAHYPGEIELHVGVVEIGRTSWQVALLALQDGRPVALGKTVMVSSGPDGAALPDPFRAELEARRVKLG